MRTTKMNNQQIQALLVIGLVYVGALAGVAAATEPYQTWQWALVGAALGLLIGLTGSLLLSRFTSAQPGTPQSGTQLPAGTHATAFEVEFPVEGACTKDDYTLDLLLYAAYAFIQPTGQPLPNLNAQGQISSSFDARNLIESTLAAATTQIVIQKSMAEVINAEASGTLAQSIRSAANTALVPWDHEIVTLYIKRISPPEKIRSSRIDQWAAEEEAESAIGIQAARLRYQDTLRAHVSALETAYLSALKEKLTRSRVNERLLALSLHNTKAQAAPAGLWPASLEEFLLALDSSISRSGFSRFFRR